MTAPSGDLWDLLRTQRDKQERLVLLRIALIPHGIIEDPHALVRRHTECPTCPAALRQYCRKAGDGYDGYSVIEREVHTARLAVFVQHCLPTLLQQPVPDEDALCAWAEVWTRFRLRDLPPDIALPPSQTHQRLRQAVARGLVARPHLIPQLALRLPPREVDRLLSACAR